MPTRILPPTPTQLKAVATFAATGVMTTDNRVISALVRRQLVTRTGDRDFALTDDGKALAASPAARRSVVTKCCVDGCSNNVFGEHNMCSQHLSRWLDGRLKPKGQQGKVLTLPGLEDIDGIAREGH
jgi:hypothetical protein